MWQQTISQSPDSAPGSDRRIDLDWVRIAAFGLLIFYHVGMLYVSWGFHIKSAHRIVALEPVMLVLNPWRLALLFLVSGVATRFMLGKYNLGPLLRSRSARLLIPLVFGMLVIVPPQAYDQIVEALGYPAGFVDFYQRHYFAFGPQFCPTPCILLPTWNHLWFVAYLWVYTVALGGVLWLAPGLLGWIERRLASALSGVLLLVVPPLLLAAYRLVLLPHFPSTHALFGDWYNHALFATVFLFGFVLARATAVWEAMERLRWLALSLAAGFFLCFLAVRANRYGGVPLKMYAGVAYASYQWLCMVALLGFARRWLTADSPARRYLTDAIFPYYIVHQTAIIMIAHALHGQGLPAWLEAGIVIFGTIAACVATYEIVRRVTILRPLFGLRMASEPAMPVRARSQPAQ
ncbi:acyltransferase family protein [Bradyrhizobium sp. AUGA SZCCT0169]|uniref:acyltransferase family protein n=1 Tax=Bradyrhizobium sp. AUGA SZCCT0169 TaxID=2807663 RepID=UPI001BA6F6E6|nr:acyltransferase family protein [Bradyrhizobium sp. AUGA SZCCT0169]MBR1247868.1 acyltransferase family protein [Bradyrhizobium sp. AUGA SZCCT0169]